MEDNSFRVLDSETTLSAIVADRSDPDQSKRTKLIEKFSASVIRYISYVYMHVSRQCMYERSD